MSSTQRTSTNIYQYRPYTLGRATGVLFGEWQIKFEGQELFTLRVSEEAAELYVSALNGAYQLGYEHRQLEETRDKGMI